MQVKTKPEEEALSVITSKLSSCSSVSKKNKTLKGVSGARYEIK